MGWIAYSGSAVVAAFIIHSLLSRNSRARDATTTTTTPSKSQDHNLQDVQSGSQVIPLSTQPTPSPPVLLEVSPPSLAVEEKDDLPLQLRHNEYSTDKPRQTSTLMPPPPPRPRSSSPPRLKPPSFGAMPAPPRPSNGQVRPPPPLHPHCVFRKRKSFPIHLWLLRWVFRRSGSQNRPFLNQATPHSTGRLSRRTQIATCEAKTPLHSSSKSRPRGSSSRMAGKVGMHGPPFRARCTI